MTTRDYEALIILKPGGTEQELARHAAQLEEPIKKIGGSIERAQSMGRRRLAFRISRQAEGHYHLLRFRAPTEQIGALKRSFLLNEAVVRFMILSADEADAASAVTARPAVAAAGRQAGPAPSRHPAGNPRS